MRIIYSHGFKFNNLRVLQSLHQWLFLCGFIYCRKRIPVFPDSLLNLTEASP